MEENGLIPHLFRTEYQKLVSVLCYRFGLDHIEIAEDIVSDTFLAATENWSTKGIPDNPVGWLYVVAKNKTRNVLKRETLFREHLKPDLEHSATQQEEIELDLSDKNISDSQLAMIFAVCHPSISSESQVALALNILCGFSAAEIADAFLTNQEVIYKRITRAREKLKAANIRPEPPSLTAINERLENVLKTLYLLFSEGYYSSSQNTVLRKDLCVEAMRLNYMLVENEATNTSPANALLALMCFHSSRFDARTDDNGDAVLYHDQDETQWSEELIKKGEYYLYAAANGRVTKYHLEAAIAYWHTHKADSKEKWSSILDLYNHRLILEYSPIVALNRIYALAKVKGKEQAIKEAEKLQLKDNHFYYSLLGELYSGIDNDKAIHNFDRALHLAHSDTARALMLKNIERLMELKKS